MGGRYYKIPDDKDERLTDKIHKVIVQIRLMYL